MAPNDAKSSFWVTMPGILTGLAALITASGGIILGLYQYGALGSRPVNPSPNANSSMANSMPAPVHTPTKEEKIESSGAPGVPVPTPTSANDRQHIRITRTNGSVMTALPDGFYFCSHWNAVELDGGQSVDFERMNAIHIVKLERESTGQYATTLRIQLIKGVDIVGVTHCSEPEAVTGNNELGDMHVSLREIKEIRFPQL
jgi:hypothetical protein